VNDWGWAFMWSIVAICVAVVTIAKLRAKECPTDRDLDRACLLATGNAQRHAAWLEPGHLRREAALLLLSADAAWAPVCAKDARAGERLRDRITDETGTPDAPRATELARELVHLLSETP
jgi:hypothetical protein